MEREEIQKITAYIFLLSDPQPADLAFIFGTSTMEPPVTVAADLYNKGWVPKILVSGGANRKTGIEEAQAMATRLVGRGVPAADIIIEDQSNNSLENVLFSRDMIISELGWDAVRSIDVVCKNYHSRRALMTLKKHLPAEVMLHPVTYSILGFDRHNWFESEEGRSKVLAEWEKIPKYLAKGDIAEL